MAWLAGYSKRKPITVTGGASGAQTDFQIKLAAVYDADMQSDFDDLRFTQADGTTLIDAWLESKVDNDSAVVWAEFPTTPANTVEQTYYMYYGKVVANYWDGPATFLQYHGAATANFIDALSVSPTNVAWEGKIKRVGTTNVLWGLANTQAVNDDTLMIQSHTNNDLRYVYAGNENVTSSLSEAPELPYNTWVRGKITCDGSTVYGYIDDNEIGAAGIASNLPDENLGLFLYEPVGAAAQEWSFARKYAANPPTYVFGVEEDETPGVAAPTSIFYGPFVGPFGGMI